MSAKVHIPEAKRAAQRSALAQLVRKNPHATEVSVDFDLLTLKLRTHVRGTKGGKTL
jgi:hypothetical protein